VAVAGFKESTNGSSVTSIVMSAVCVNPPPVAVMVRIYVEGGVVVDGFTVRELSAVPLMICGKKVAVEPDRRPVRESVTGLLNPFTGLRLTVKGACPPGGVLWAEGVTAISKSGSPLVSSILTERATPPLLSPRI